MDLPTYTNIWRIEKRLYKLYDFRLPMPLPVGQIAVFAAIAVPYVVILKLVGLPFSHTLLWLYILPPGALAWVVTRPVLESKRLPELVVSQVRYLAEPRTWCRMAPLAEKDQVFIVARVWRRANGTADVRSPEMTSQPVLLAAGKVSEPLPPVHSRPEQAWPARHSPTGPVPTLPGLLGQGTSAVPARPAAGRAPQDTPAGRSGRPAPAARPAATGPSPAAAGPAPSAAPARPALALPPARPVPPVPPAAPPAPAAAAAAGPADVPSPQAPAAGPDGPPGRPVVSVTGEGHAERPFRAVERALGNPAERRGVGWRDHVVVVPGGHRPGKPDQLQRDRVRVRLPLPGGHRVVVLGCTVGAGQTMTALMTGEVLASLRDDQVAVLDLNPGAGSLSERAMSVPALTGARSPEPSRLEVVTHEVPAAGGRGNEDGQGAGRVFELLSARYPLTITDPGAAAVARVLATASHLMLVAPASQDAASALTTTREWLEAHGHADLADESITVLNGVSRHTLAHVEQAEALARGRCRAIVRIPWDDRLRRTGHRTPPGTAPDPAAGPLSPAALHAYTALAGVLVVALASSPERLRARS